MNKWPDKDPDAYKDYAIDWTRRLASGETITQSEWSDNSGGALELIGGAIDSGRKCTIWIDGGEAGRTYRITNRITTSRGMIDDQTVQLKVANQ